MDKNSDSLYLCPSQTHSLSTKGQCRVTKFTLISAHPKVQKDTRLIWVKALSFTARTKPWELVAAPRLHLRDDRFSLMSTVSCKLKCIFFLLCPVNFHLPHIIQLRYYFLREIFPCLQPVCSILHPYLVTYMFCHDMWHICLCFIALTQVWHMYLEITW